jgi:hypothetical protein
MTSNQPESNRAACERLTRDLGFTVTRQAYRWWIKKGYPVADLNGLRRKLLDQERMPTGADPKRLRADMNRQPLFGRRLREVLEDMPLGLIGDLDAATDRRGRLQVLCDWVRYALSELGTRGDHPEGLRLTMEEVWEIENEKAERYAEETGEV